jgi:hypothetical protein
MKIIEKTELKPTNFFGIKKKQTKNKTKKRRPYGKFLHSAPMIPSTYHGSGDRVTIEVIKY